MRSKMRRINREKKTVEVMINLFCKNKHTLESGRCNSCQELLDYACEKIDHCKFSSDKPTCAQCKIHCYQPKMREEIKTVMKFAGPRMLWHHPILLILHISDSRKRRSSKRG